MSEAVDLTKVFYYDETSPSGLRWAIDVSYNGLFGGSALKCKAGDVAGTFQKANKRWKVKYQQKTYMAHRVIYELHYGKPDRKLVIDHIDGNSGNNVITNLRLVTQSLNARNSKKLESRANYTTGVTFREVYGSAYYAAAWVNPNGKMGNKYFPIKKYGEELAEFLACEYRLHMIDLLNIQGHGYTDRHGK